MSIVGTRPPLIGEVSEYELHHRARLAIKPGITGALDVTKKISGIWKKWETFGRRCSSRLVCRIISAFGTGITDFELVDVPIEKVLNGLPKSLQDRTMSNIEQKQVEIRNSHQIKGIDMILRTRVENECCKY